MINFFEFGLVLGLLAVASNPSPFYAALGLVGAAGAGCFILAGSASFLSLVLFLVYLGGMMVVFAYSAALVAEPYPEAWGSTGVVLYTVSYGALLLVWWVLGKTEGEDSSVLGGDVVLTDWLGVSALFSEGGWVLLIVGWALLLTLFVVLEVVRGHYSGVLRAV
uniref:NADH-ubiquinone oxidoreductase chain 6 n=1 Tax=Platyplectrum melanopyga TaxID=3345241 RepID=K9JZA6_PLAME|nr:NADH dehydrogenase subunit 6 [Lechriodus melanopyga]AEC33160.1 NADH dehydrogenase subunit 6 [Lechriodus melanopyga]